MILPIGTDVRPRRAPVMNWAIIAVNVVIWVFTNTPVGGRLGAALKDFYMLDAARPQLYQYITYQFLHDDWQHILGNMLFLWIFGNAVCDRMGGLYYLLFYLGGGVVAGVAYAHEGNSPLLGASGAIASVTTAFLVLYPRVHITMIVLYFTILTFQIPAILLITFKIILWDNIVSPRLSGGMYSNVAYGAHLGGYAYGFVVAIVMLAARGLPRNQFDLLALWGRYRRRTTLASQVTFGSPRPRAISVEQMDSRPIDRIPLTPTERLREQVVDHIAERDLPSAAEQYARMIAIDPTQVLPRGQQIDLANYLAGAERYSEAVTAYEAYLAAYPTAPDIYQIRLLIGLICNRHLRHYQRAIGHLRYALEGLTQPAQIEMAQEELRAAMAELAPQQ